MRAGTPLPGAGRRGWLRRRFAAAAGALAAAAAGALAAAAVNLGTGTGPALAAEIVDITWGPDNRFSHRVVAQTAGLVEVCGTVGVGQAIRWHFEASAPLRFNMHHHEGHNVVYSEQIEAATRAEGTLAPKLTQTYCWMWDRFPREGAGLELTLQRLARPR